jgi:hypothetical protein
VQFSNSKATVMMCDVMMCDAMNEEYQCRRNKKGNE